MKLVYKNRLVEIDEGHFEFDEGYQVISASYEDTGIELTEQELLDVEYIFQEELYQNGYENMASAAYDRAKDFAKYRD